MAPDALSESTALYLSESLSLGTGFLLRVKMGMVPPPSNSIIFDINSSLSDLGEEGYELSIRTDGVRIKALHPAGLFYACQTLLQLLPMGMPGTSKTSARYWTVPCMTICDRPSFPWRGLMLDVARHFLPTDFILRYIDLMAFYKMNRLHLHLNDTQSFTLEIKKYPRLTDPNTRLSASGRVLGTYSQKDMRDIVKYARSRHVMVIPEFDLPCHSRAVLNGYPEFVCAHLPRITQGQHDYGEYCAGRDEVYDFIEDVISEISGIFDAPYIHIGGDEYDGTSWVDCPDCKQRIKTENLEAEDSLELQRLFCCAQGNPKKYLLYRYMMRRVARMVVSRNRIPILWDDLAWRGSFPEKSVIMQWHYQGALDWVQQVATPENPAREAVLAGHDTIIAAASHHYFDYFDGGALLQRLYEFDTVPQDLALDQIPRVLGPHACVWERRQDDIDGKVFPRLLALAEKGWTPVPLLSWDHFASRLQSHYQRLKILGVQYTQPQESEALMKEGLVRTWDIPQLAKCTQKWFINEIVTGNGCYEATLNIACGKETTNVRFERLDNEHKIETYEPPPAKETHSGNSVYQFTISDFKPDTL
ncbi:MAG: family 20 glycosylhydrolase, partial [Lentisphaerota bacterium]